MANEAFIIDGIRTAVGNFGGSLGPVRTDDLGAIVLKELMSRNNGFDPKLIEDVIMGCANQAGEDNRNVARMSSLLAGIPVDCGGETVNRLCSSGMASVVQSARAINCGAGEIYLAGGVENMTRGPWVISKVSTAYGRDAQMYDSSFGWRFINPRMKELYGVDGMGQTAENLVEKYGISRADQDQFAYNSQMKATAARDSGRLALEICDVVIPQRKADDIIFNQDEFIKSNTTLDRLASLRGAFKKEGGSVSAGNASGLNDGAAALLLASEKAVKDHSLKPMARVVSAAVAGVEPRVMGIGPVMASNKALQRAGLSMNDVDHIELNEAFAAQSLACIREWGLADDDPRINPNGGAIAIGHPLGMSGTRLLQTAAIELQKQNKRYALVTMCIGVGQGYATIIERA